MSVVSQFQTGVRKHQFTFTTFGALFDILRQDFRGFAQFESSGSQIERRYGIILMGKTPFVDDGVFLGGMNHEDLVKYFEVPRAVYWISEFPVYSYGQSVDTLDPNRLQKSKHLVVLTHDSRRPLNSLNSLLNDALKNDEKTTNFTINCSWWKVPAGDKSLRNKSKGPFSIVSKNNMEITKGEITWDDIVFNQHNDSSGEPKVALFYVANHVSYSESSVAHLKLYFELPPLLNRVNDRDLMNTLASNASLQQMFTRAVYDFVNKLRGSQTWTNVIMCFFGALRRLQQTICVDTNFNEATRRRAINFVVDAAAAFEHCQVRVEHTKFHHEKREDKRLKNVAGHGPLDYIIEKIPELGEFNDDDFPNYPINCYQIPSIPSTTSASSASSSSSNVSEEDEPPASETHIPPANIFALNNVLEEYDDDEFDVIPTGTRLLEAKQDPNDGLAQVSLQGRDCLFNKHGLKSAHYCFTCLSSGQTYHFMGINWPDGVPKPSLEFFGTLKLPVFRYTNPRGKSGATFSSITKKYDLVPYLDYECAVAAVVMMMRGVTKKLVVKEYRKEVNVYFL